MKKTIGYRIRKIRESKDYSQDNMGMELGITAGAYAKIERGETDPSATRLLKIAEILGVHVAVFFPDTPFVNKVEDPSLNTYSNLAKTDIDQLNGLIHQLNREVEKLKVEVAGMKKLPAKSKK